MKIFNKIKEYLGFKNNDESIPANNFIPESIPFDRFIPTSNHLLNSNFITSVDQTFLLVSGTSNINNDYNDYNIMQDNRRVRYTIPVGNISRVDTYEYMRELARQINMPTTSFIPLNNLEPIEYSNYKKERILSKLKKVYKIADSEVIDYAKFKIKNKYLIFKVNNKYKIRLKDKTFNFDEYFKSEPKLELLELSLTGMTINYNI